MSKRDASLLIEDMLDSARKIARYVTGLDYDAFLADDKTTDAVVRNLEIIGEATRQLPDDYREAHPELPWAQMAGLRNRIVHDYAAIDLELIWEIVQHSLPALRRQLDGLA